MAIPPAQNLTTTYPASGSRSDIARITIYLGIGTIAVLAAVAMYNGNGAKEATALMSMILPVVAAWVGTVLAFYFGRDNFEAATKSVRDMAAKLSPQQILESVKAADVLIPLNQIKSIQENGDEKIKQIADMFDGTVNRLPVFDASNAVKYIIHQSMMFKFIADQAMAAGSTFDANTATLATFLADPGMKITVSALAFVGESANLAEAKSKMEAVAGCQDVFVTKSGAAAEPVIGWITNTIIGKHSQA